ncbi:ankyrin repeat domain-containing protein 2 isoform X1 [Danio aesculapii]|uniref:ankyrin repeat domain-containing protein 2 isoform X1 n=1 Tax=Danio aesculapii TaxID=1142201 RepID=UPI0024BFAE00|nr:ankyrin repeat domain-containing protein 2 isoform X1 [Danio aesculapii]
MDENILWATAVVDRRAALDKREEKRRARARKLGILVVDATSVGAEGGNVSVNQSVADIQAEERVRKISSDLRREIVDLGGAENIIELRTKKKKIKNKTTLSKDKTNVPVGPVEPEEFLKAAARGKMEVVEKFLEDGGDPNTCDEFRKTALHRAALENHTKIVEKLLDEGADIDFKDRLDCRAVHWACRGGSLSALTVLQDRGADINVRDKLLSSPLHVATRTGHSDVVQHLLDSGININAKDWEGDTALHDAVRLNRYKIVKQLILAGADMQIKNAEGVTATEQVKQWQFDTKETLEKLEQMKEVGLA